MALLLSYKYILRILITGSEIFLVTTMPPENPLTSLDPDDFNEFVEWRVNLWGPVIKDALTQFGLENFSNKSVLEIGYGNGRNAVLLASLGASVTGIEADKKKISIASEYARIKGFEDRCHFLSGDFFELVDKYDIIVTKSVLFRIKTDDEYDDWIKKFTELLKPGGSVLAVENGNGLDIVRKMRLFYHRWKHRNVKNLKYKGYQDNILSKPVVLDIFNRYFSEVDIKPFYLIAPIVPVKPFVKWEIQRNRAKFNNCFVFWIHAACPKH